MFFESVKRVLRPGGRLILQDYTAPKLILWLMNHTEMPLANLVGHGDVAARSLDEIKAFCDNSGLKIEKIMHAKLIRTHTVATGADSCDYWYVPDESETARSYTGQIV